MTKCAFEREQSTDLHESHKSLTNPTLSLPKSFVQNMQTIVTYGGAVSCSSVPTFILGRTHGGLKNIGQKKSVSLMHTNWPNRNTTGDSNIRTLATYRNSRIRDRVENGRLHTW